jgi:hypothetical protein
MPTIRTTRQRHSPRSRRRQAHHNLLLRAGFSNAKEMAVPHIDRIARSQRSLEGGRHTRNNELKTFAIRPKTLSENSVSKPRLSFTLCVSTLELYSDSSKNIPIADRYISVYMLRKKSRKQINKNARYIVKHTRISLFAAFGIERYLRTKHILIRIHKDKRTFSANEDQMGTDITRRIYKKDERKRVWNYILLRGLRTTIKQRILSSITTRRIISRSLSVLASLDDANMRLTSHFKGVYLNRRPR